MPKERQAFLSWQADLAKMAGLRKSVVKFGLSKIDAAGAYTSILTGGDNVLKQAIAPVLTGPLGVQATDLLTMARAAQDVGEESDLLRADLIAGSFPPADLMLISQLAVRHQEEWAQTFPDLDPVLRGYFRTIIPFGRGRPAGEHGGRPRPPGRPQPGPYPCRPGRPRRPPTSADSSPLC